eukprot:TRINITY_DN2271_c0_g1::TRINITY_DN2271_c0_g1_i1::g.6733::m.6733 TRINITY_DN2271_c0_g1::TRINITY_DN2271_c0_g1_i1::g.6733  ORF type:complete len:441 (+),score=79.53,TPR_17/PF13431.1/0.29,TPR_17/PF13431.1/0.0021,TPR_17/PF13431.1/0.00027,TPR_17/PF13431.1/6.6,TPR_17/PF13431.1/2.7,TPR_11/PF13414.1/57,TPR_11/PF13414.1/0.78,TPR_11/PF13414.1/0.024,TPR_11/PF13414.1/6,TPR_11/PF13414.1/3.2,TPR_14/PF13428.1/2.5e+02,TPR_14/PF13428.1/1.7e+03,TPR_14/PF13428.1/2.5e+02,TPR_14/PF13428.1/1.2e+02,TPR_14/PF13428.1/1.5e+0
MVRSKQDGMELGPGLGSGMQSYNIMARVEYPKGHVKNISKVEVSERPTPDLDEWVQPVTAAVGDGMGPSARDAEKSDSKTPARPEIEQETGSVEVNETTAADQMQGISQEGYVIPEGGDGMGESNDEQDGETLDLTMSLGAPVGDGENPGIDVGDGNGYGTYRTLEECQEAIARDANDADAFFCLALHMNEGLTKVQPAGSSAFFITKNKAYLTAIQKDPKMVPAYNNLALLLYEDTERVYLTSKQYNRKQLFLEALEINPKYAYAYNNLANLMTEAEIVTVNGQGYNRRDMYLLAIMYNKRFAEAYNNLAGVLNGDETVQLPTGEQSTKKELCEKALKLSPDSLDILQNMCIAMKAGDTTMALGKQVTHKELRQMLAEMAAQRKKRHLDYSFNSLDFESSSSDDDFSDSGSDYE